MSFQGKIINQLFDEFLTESLMIFLTSSFDEYVSPKNQFNSLIETKNIFNLVVNKILQIFYWIRGPPMQTFFTPQPNKLVRFLLPTTPSIS